MSKKTVLVIAAIACSWLVGCSGGSMDDLSDCSIEPCDQDIGVSGPNGDSTNGNGQGGGNSTNGNSNSQPGSFTVSWQAPTRNSDGSALANLAGYRIYYGIRSGEYTERVRINGTGLTRYVVENVSADTYFVTMTAINDSGIESDYSQEIAVVSN